MFKVWYDMNGEYAEEVFNTLDEAFIAFDEAVKASHTEGDYIELYDLNKNTAIEWFENEEPEDNPDFYDEVDECGFNPYMGGYDYDC